MELMSELIELAESFAMEAHITQVRKYTGQPYVNHALAVSAIVAAYGGNQSQIVAALLHDTVEDTYTTLTDHGAIRLRRSQAR